MKSCRLVRQNYKIHKHYVIIKIDKRYSFIAYHYNFISGHISVINNLIYVLSFSGDKQKCALSGNYVKIVIWRWCQINPTMVSIIKGIYIYKDNSALNIPIYTLVSFFFGINDAKLFIYTEISPLYFFIYLFRKLASD